jgi:hypothetical protein
MSKTTDLAAQYVNTATQLDQLYLSLNQSQPGLASQIALASSNLKQAASTLYAIDVVDTIDETSAPAAQLAALTAALTSQASKISGAQKKVTLVSGIATTLATVFTDLTSGNIVAAGSAAMQVVSSIGQL